jgi:uroporphyrinogen decarboxylase
MLESCLTPDLAVEITLQPVRRHKVDAAIFFSDIVIPLKLAGIAVEIVAGVGPVIDQPIETDADLERLKPLTTESLQPITEAVTRLVAELGSTPLIGFGGAPFTLASYLIEGGPSKDLTRSRAMMREQPLLWDAVLTWCAEITTEFIKAQVLAGASALQVFDSWAGKLSTEDYEQFAAPYTQKLFTELATLIDDSGQPVPRIHFGVGTGKILRRMLAVGATVIGVDSETDLSAANELLGEKVALQGNIDTAVLSKPWAEIEAEVRAVLAAGTEAPGHVVNLGHGVPKDTDPEVLTKIVELVHELTA